MCNTIVHFLRHLWKNCSLPYLGTKRWPYRAVHISPIRLSKLAAFYALHANAKQLFAMNDATVDISSNTVTGGPLGLLDCPNEVIGMIAKALIPGTSETSPYYLGLELSHLCSFVRVNRRLYTQFSNLLYLHNVTMVNSCGDVIAADLAAEWSKRPPEGTVPDRERHIAAVWGNRLGEGVVPLTAMPFAALHGRIETARRVIAMTPEVCAVHSVKIALQKGHVDIAMLLLGTETVKAKIASQNAEILRNVDPHRYLRMHSNAVCEAIVSGKVEVIQEVLPPGTNLNFDFVAGRPVSRYWTSSPLRLACEYGHLDAVRYLLDLGGEDQKTINNLRLLDLTPLGCALNGRHTAVVTELIHRYPWLMSCSRSFCEALESKEDDMIEKFFQSAGGVIPAWFQGWSTNLLHAAIASDEVSYVRRLLDLGVEVAVAEGHIPWKYTERPPLEMAAARCAGNPNAVEIAQLLVSRTPGGFSPCSMDLDKFLEPVLKADNRPLAAFYLHHVSHDTIMSAMGLCRSVPMIQLLLEHGADLDAGPTVCASFRVLPLFECAGKVLHSKREPEHRMYEAFEFMARNVSSINAVCPDAKCTVLQYICSGMDGVPHYDDRAFRARQERMVDFLLKCGADPNMAAGQIESPLHEAVWTGGSLRLIESLLEAGADPNAPGVMSETPLHTAADRSFRGWSGYGGEPNEDKYDFAKIEVLLRFGADRHALNKYGIPALHIYASLPKAIISRLLDLGADPRLRCRDGETLLEELECRDEYVLDVVEKVFRLYPETVHAKDQNRFTPLQYWIGSRCLKIARHMLKHGAAQSINAVNDWGQTALDMYYLLFQPGERDEDFIQLMREHGAIRLSEVDDETRVGLMKEQNAIWDRSAAVGPDSNDSWPIIIGPVARAERQNSISAASEKVTWAQVADI